MVAGLGQINGDLFPEDRSRAMVMSYDYMVLAGTQGMKNHDKKDRLFEVAEQQRLPTVLFAEVAVVDQAILTDRVLLA